jgi:hypothetical protein
LRKDRLALAAGEYFLEHPMSLLQKGLDKKGQNLI